jgi:hypothetical protein
LGACRLQVAGIYLHAAAGKFQHEEWANGTAIYYWFTHPLIGARGWVLALVGPLVVTRGVALITWGTIVFEFFLAAAIIAPRKPRQVLLAAGIAFHGGILPIHGLVSFADHHVRCARPLMRMPDEKSRFLDGGREGHVRGFLAARGSQGPALSSVHSKCNEGASRAQRRSVRNVSPPVPARIASRVLLMTLPRWLELLIIVNKLPT